MNPSANLEGLYTTVGWSQWELRGSATMPYKALSAPTEGSGTS
jgi:hypothetical protein